MQHWWHCRGACQEGWDLSPFGLPWAGEQQERAPAGHLHKIRVFIPPAAGLWKLQGGTITDKSCLGEAPNLMGLVLMVLFLKAI